MSWRALYRDGTTLAEGDRPYAELPRDDLVGFQLVDGDNVLFETTAPYGADGYDLRYRFRGERRADGQPGAQRFIIGWDPTGPAFLIDSGGTQWQSDNFHDVCDESCQHPHGWFDAPVAFDSERRSN